MNYDQWKTRSPDDEDAYDALYDDDYDPRIDCDHEHSDMDVCTGRCVCDVCGHSWYVTSEEVNAELDRRATYWEDVERDERRRWWRDQFDRIAFWRWRWRKRKIVSIDDEIPF